MNITIYGAGNVGTQFAVHCASKGHRTTIFTSKPERISKTLTIIDENDKVTLSSTIDNVTNDAFTAFNDADLVFVIIPSYCMDQAALTILPYVHANMHICIVPGTGAAEAAFDKCIKKGAILCGLQRVLSVARLVEYGKTVRAIGYRSTLHVCTIPISKAAEFAKTIEGLFDIKTVALPNYLNITLTPSNPILHTTRLKVLFQDYKPGKVYDKVDLFYQQWNDESSDLLLKADDEVQQICHKLSMFDLSYVKSLKEHYESDTVDKMTKKISSIKGFQGLTSPTVKVEGGYIPDFSSRYFTADFPYGLAILIQIANFTQVDCPNLINTYNWYHSLCPNIQQFNYSDYNIHTLEDFIHFYQR